MPIAYEPPPDEIRNRAKILLWMQEQEWSDAFITSVMIYDSPNIQTVWRMVKQYGPKDAYTKMIRMME